MDFRILGPLEVLDEGQSVTLGGSKQRALLALLLVHANETLTTERLIDELWGDDPPANAAKTVQVHVSRLRKALAADAAGGPVVTREGGYELDLDPEQLDSQRFETLVAEGRSELEAGRPQSAVAALEPALSLWRGSPLTDLAYEPFAQAEIARLEDLRLRALEHLIEAKLALGGHAEVIAQLEALIAEHPYRENLRAQLMLALYRCDRQADALQAYQSARQQLVGELGIEPSERLRELEGAILSHDPALEPPAAPQGRDGTAAPRDPAPEVRDPGRKRDRNMRRVLLAGGVLLAGAAAVTAAFVVLGEGGAVGGLAKVEPDSVAVLDPGSNRIDGEVAIPGQPSLVAADARSVWVASDTSRTISRIDGRSLSVTKVVAVNATPGDLAATSDAVWLLDAERPALVKVDAAYGSVTKRITLPAGRGGGGVDVGHGAVWVANRTTHLLKLDPEDGNVIATFDLGRPIDDVAAGAGAVWAISGKEASALEIDPASGSVRARIPITSRPGSTRPVPLAVTAGEDSVWVLNGNTPSVTRIEPQLSAVTATTPLGVASNPTAIATGAGAVWVPLSGDGTVARVHPRTGAVRSIRLGGAPTGVAVSPGRVWTSVQPGFRGGLARGRTLRVPGAISEPFCSPVEFAEKGTPRFLIASDFPLQGGSGSFSPALQFPDAVRFVLARRDFRAGSYSVGYQSCDDSAVVRERPYNWTPATCRRNARAFADTAMVLGVIGPFDSACAAIQIPVLNRARGGPLAEISGSTTLVGLTHEGPGSLPREPEAYYPRGVRNFARVIATDDVQGAAGALMAKRLGVSRLYVLDDATAYGVAIAASVRETATELGMMIAGSGEWDHDERRFTRLAEKIERSGADGVFLGGILDPAGPTPVRDLRAVLGRRVQILAPDGFSDFDALTRDTGPAGEGVIVSVPIVPPARLPASGRRFVRAFERAIGRRADHFSITAAQATDALLDAIAASDGTRASVTRNLLRVRVRNGILGSFEFDANGDTTGGGVTMYGIEQGEPRILDVITAPGRLVP
jgi:DNA-binding SARP family transcriptional activator/ABC-type branched-subunit amino acid transport system substrate-binding protein/streptogramin lyase